MANSRRNRTRKGVEILPSVTSEKGLNLVSQQINKGNDLLNNRPLNSDKYIAWETVTRDFLRKIFGSLSPNVSSVTEVGKYGSFPQNAGSDWWENHHANSLSKKVTIMEGLLEVLQTEISINHGHEASGSFPLQVSANARTVFLVHGQDSASENITSRFIEQLARIIHDAA